MTLLLIVIYIAFIGLGIPDSLIGAAWPAIYPEMHLPVEAVSTITMLVSGCTVLSSLCSVGVLNRFGTAKVTAASTAMTAFSLLGFSIVPNFYWMLPLAVVLGLGAGAIDAGLNNYVALHFQASHMNFLHCFYGVGVSLSPYLMSRALTKTEWRDGYRYVFCIQICISLMLILSVPLWKKNSSGELVEEEPTINLSFLQMIKMPSLRTAWLLMLATNALETICGAWGSTYLVNAKGFLPEEGALGLTIYYAGLTMGRFLSGLISEKIKTWNRIWIGCGIVAASVFMILLPLPGMVSVASLFLMGLGNGSIYPNLMHLTPHNFGKEISQSVMGSQIAFAYMGAVLAPLLTGLVTGLWGIQSYPILLAVIYAGMVLSLCHFVSLLKKQKTYNKNI